MQVLILGEAGSEQQSERELWALSDFCRKHSLSRARVYELLASGVLEARKVGRKTVIPEEARQRWLQSLPRFESKAVA